MLLTPLSASATTWGADSLMTDSGAVIVDPESQTLAVEDIDVSIQMPGEITESVVDVSQVPEVLLSATGPALLSTNQDSTLISSYATDDGVQTLIQIPDASAPSEYRFPLNLPVGGQAALFDDGSVVISDDAGVATGGFRAPWAVDANGDSIPTSFRIEGTTLIQTVAIDADTVFPVTADPDLGTEWWGYYVQLTRAETKKAASVIANNQGAGVLAGVVCGALPGPAALGCGAAIALAYFALIDPINRANAAGKCVAINYPWLALSNPPIGWTSINATTVNCRR